MNPRGLIHLFIVYVVWGSTYLAIRVAVRDGSGFPAFMMAGTRVLVASAILLAWAALSRRPLKPNRRDFRVFVSSGILLWLGGNGLVSWAETRAESAHTALLVASSPLWVNMLESIVDRRRPTLRLVGALVVGLSGVAVLNGPLLRNGTSADALAALALIAAVLSWGVGTIYQKRRGVSLSPEANSGYQQLFGGVALLLAAVLLGEPRPDPRPDAIAAWAYLIVFGSVIAFTSFVKALQLLPVGVVMTYAYVNPVIAVILGRLVLGEAITRWTVLGSALVILGVAGVFHEQKRMKAPAAFPGSK